MEGSIDSDGITLIFQNASQTLKGIPAGAVYIAQNIIFLVLMFMDVEGSSKELIFCITCDTQCLVLGELEKLK